MPHRVRIVVRDSPLSIKQAEEAINVFKTGLDFTFEIIKIKSFGDKNKRMSLMGNKMSDIWTREPDEMLLKGEADVAIHSTKDLPVEIKKGLCLVALLPCIDHSDSLVARDGLMLDTLPMGARVGTCSLLRKNELLKYRKDLRIVSIRGTIEERIALIKRGKVDAIVVATCALKRLGLTEAISQILPFQTHPLQGSLAVVVRETCSLKDFFGQFDVRNDYGRLYLVGFGPGNTELLTVKARALLKKADVVFYDDLIDGSYLRNFRCKKVYVGKRKGVASFTQEQINVMMYQEVTSGNDVVRLKGGDPFIFGRGYDEVSFFHDRFVDVVVLPGVTAALAASSYSGIPLTARGVSSSVGLFTGHKQGGKSITDFKIDTKVFYMASSHFKGIAKGLKKSGLSKDSLVAVVTNVSCYNQREYFFTLDEVLKKEIVIESPSIVIVGDVVGLYNRHYSFSQRKKLLYTGTEPERYEYLGSLFHYPVIKIVGIRMSSEIKTMIEGIDKYDVVVFTSKFAVRCFFRILLKHGLDARILKGKRIAVIGERTALALKKLGILHDVMSEKENSADFFECLNNLGVKNCHVLLPCSNLSANYLKDELERGGNKVDKIVVYKNIFNDGLVKLDLSYFDGIIFTSPSTVKNFKEIYATIPEKTTVYLKDGPTLDTFKKEFANEKITSL